jgi:hypothetical protein
LGRAVVVVVGLGRAVVVVVVGGSVVVVVGSGLASEKAASAERVRLERPDSGVAYSSTRADASSASETERVVDDAAETVVSAGAESDTAARAAMGTSNMPADSASAGSQRRP